MAPIGGIEQLAQALRACGGVGADRRVGRPARDARADFEVAGGARRLALLALQLHYLAAHPPLAAPDLTPAVIAHMRRQRRLYALIPLASMAVSFYSPRVGMYLYLVLAIPTFAPSRVDRLLYPPEHHPGANSSEEP